jgi:putative NIF3 family GTP cyclohydrolase 1 type 2
MKIKEFINEFEQIIPIRQAEDFDNVGFCGSPDRDISGILLRTMLWKTLSMKQLKRIESDVLFSSHYFFWSQINYRKNYVERAVLKALENKIAIYAIHTAFDNDYFGVNYKICEVLGLKNQKF